MTELGAGVVVPPADPPPADSTEPVSGQPISYARKIARLTFARIGAKLGVLWITIMAVVAAFAPFLANSHPILMKSQGHWSSPLFQYFTPVDVVLQVLFWTLTVLYCMRRLPLLTRTWIFVTVAVLSIAIAGETIKPKAAPVYDAYRTALQSGQISQAHFVPIRYSPDDHQRDLPDARVNRPSLVHPMGTTSDAADLASNLIYGSRIALSIGFVATSVAIVLGVVMGGLMGYFGGWIDLIGMRLVEIFESIPTLLLLLAFASRFQRNPEQALYIMMALIGVLTSFGYAEFVRAEFLSLRDRDFVHAAQAAGLPLWSILFRHMLPNGMTPVIVNASFGIAGAILTESTLSFLGIGLQSEASWGSLLSQALGSGGSFFWWLALYPGLAIFLTVFSYNLIGESMRDALDPRLNKMA
jgi:peptide/nickel transport system permease protein